MENKQINLHMDRKRASLVMLFFALALVFNGVLAILSIGKNLAQISSLLRSDYEYSVTMKTRAKAKKSMTRACPHRDILKLKVLHQPIEG